MTLLLKIVLTVLSVLVALAIALALRGFLVRRLRRTFLDTWVVQTLGVLVALLPFILLGYGIPLIWKPGLLLVYWDKIQLYTGPHLVDLLFNLIYTLLLIALGFGVARTIQRITVSNLGSGRIDINIRKLVGRILYFLVLTLTVFWILSLWQISVAVPVTIVSVITVALTVAVQDLLKDLFAGFYILIERPFHIGDQISTLNVVSYVGRVEDVQLRVTKLRLVSGEEVMIPNSYVFNNIIINNTLYGERRATITIKLPLDDFHKDETPTLILHAVNELPHIALKPEPSVTLSNLTPQDVTLATRFWITNGELSTVTAVMYTLHKVLPTAELTVQESAGNV
jgi:small-conductance mechanosensitive channel